MKQTFLIGAFALTLTATVARAIELGEPVWETTGLRTPESVLVHELGGRRVLLVSEIEGDAFEHDGAGGIALLSTSGEWLDRDFIRGLNAPKGMAVHNNRLYVADIDELIVIELSTREIIERHAVPGAVLLNDVAIDEDGIVYVSDSHGGRLYRLLSGRIETVIADIPGANGLHVSNDGLVIGAQRKLLLRRQGALQEIASGFEADLDGVVALRDGGYVVTAWVGLIYHVSDRGDVRLLLDSRSRQVNTADIGYDPVTHMLYVPTFSANSVRAYRLRGAHEKTGE